MRRPPSYTPTVGLIVQRTIGRRAGQLITITSVRDLGGRIFNIRGFYPNEAEESGGDAENYILSDSVRQEVAGDGFAVGQRAIISERVNSPREGHEYDCSIAAPHVGTECVIAALDRDDRVRITWNNGSNSWWLWREYLDPVDRPVPLTPATPFDNAWRLAKSGVPLPVLMDLLWADIAKPIQTLSRARGEWGALIITRAVLRMRRQMPNSYEEQTVKNHAFTETRLWQLTWAAATKR